jgi:hypothetical protein
VSTHRGLVTALLFLFAAACGDNVHLGGGQLLVSPQSGLETSESGLAATFTVALSKPPAGDVVIDVTSSNVAEGTVVPAQLTFTRDTYAAAQTVTITGVDDHVVDGPQAYVVHVAPDDASIGLAEIDVDVTNADNDAASVIVSPTTGLVTTESGGQATFSIVLGAQPSADVAIPLTSSNTQEGTIATTMVTFTHDDWNAPQLLTITGVDDHVADGPVAYTIVTGATTSSDPLFAGIDPDDVQVTNLDNDSPGFLVTPTSGLVTTESGGTASYTVALLSQPLANVTVSVSSARPSEATAAPASLTFTPANWNAPQTVTVTGIDDLVADGDQTFTIVNQPATSADPGYNGLDPADVTGTNLDNDTAGVLVKPTNGLVTTESGGQATFTVVLLSQPTADVTIALASNDTTEGVASPTSLTFTSANWNAPQTVTVTGIDDLIADGNQPYTIVLSPASSSDPGYNGIDPADVSCTNLDNDSPGIVVQPTTGLVTTESGGTATFTIVLQSQPIANVTISLTTSKPTEGKPSPTSVTFTAADWNAPQTVTVTGVDDQIADGDQTYFIITNPAISADPNYNGRNAADVQCTNLDNDTAGFVVTPTSGLVTTESGGVAHFTVQLLTQPTANVTIPISTSDATEGTPSVTQLTFTPQNWAAAQTVTVTGVDDTIADGNQPYTIVLAPVISSDPVYNARDPADVSVTNLDNDTPGILVTPTSGIVTSERGRQDYFTVVLLAPPTANVTIGISSSDVGEGTVFPSSLTFTTANWNQPQTVTATGVDDLVPDGNQVYTIITAPATSTDLGYNGLDAADVVATNLDNDSPGFTVTPTSGLLTSEIGDTDAFTVVLDTQPTADVTITLTSSDPTEAAVTPASITFTPTTWNVPVKVTVSGINDSIVDGNIAYTIITGVATSADAAYNGIDPPDVRGTNIDNDTAQVYVKAASRLFTSESGTSATYLIRLMAAPLANVTCPITSMDTTEDTVTPMTVTFTPTGFGFVTVAVKGVADGIKDGDQLVSILNGTCTSADPAYNGQDPNDVSVVNHDIN